MLIARTIDTLLTALAPLTRNGVLDIGFVPTMGALHEGHLSLLRESKIRTEITVCSIFVNPTQFNNKEDLKHYPRLVEDDIELLHATQCDVLFLPDEDEIYPPSYPVKHFDLGYLESIFEGKFRPGHFQGVCKVVDRLIDIVRPHHVYLGQKDYQQCMVIKRLLELRNMPGDPELHIQPTLREESGLAMSSRNLRLTPDQRVQATAIFQLLLTLKSSYHSSVTEQLEAAGMKTLQASGFEPDYVALVDARTLLPPTSKTDPVVALVAAALGKVRLIDNMLIQ